MSVARLVDRAPVVRAERLIADLRPPPRFADVRFTGYLPDPAEPSQAAALDTLTAFAAGLHRPPRRGLPRGLSRGLRRGLSLGRGPGLRPRSAPEPAGVYLDGGFGVGKTHLLASLWHAVPAPKAYGTFVEITHLVGALGFAGTVDALAGHRLLCVDEFELDDPGDTVLVSSLLSRLVERGVRLAATSNTLPGRLGEGRFAAADFRREIQGLSEHFAAVRIDGEDYRHRGRPEAPVPYADDALAARAAGVAGGTLDDWPALLDHLAGLHPSRYGALLDGVAAVHLRGVAPLTDQNVALRVVVLADRLYDRDVPVAASGVPWDAVFGPEMLAGGYRKKYLRALSRLTALARAATPRVVTDSPHQAGVTPP